MTALTAEQARALIGLRAKLWWRRIVQGRHWVRFAVGILAAGLGTLFSASLCILVIQAAGMLGRHPARLWSRGGPAAIFARVTLAWMAS